MSEQVKRYDYGYKDDGCGGDRYLGLIEKPDGALVRHSDYAALEAECDKLRAQVSALQSDANSWQSGYDKGREDGAKAAEGWKAQHARDSAELRRLCAQRDALAAELAAIKGQQPVAFYWQDIGYPEPRKHGPYFGWPSESALRNVDGGAIPVPLYTLPPATLSPEVQASGPYASVADALAQRYPKPSLLDLGEFAKRAALEMGKHDFHGFEPVVLAVVEELLAAPTVKAEQVQCEVCHGQGEVYSGHDQHFHYFDFQPPEPIMEVCPECGGEEAPSLPAAGSAVEEVEVVAWQDAENPLYTTAERRVMHEWAGNQYPIVELMTVAQHNRIIAALSAQQSAQPEFCCKHSYKVAKQKAWNARDLTNCKCDHNEYCEHCWPDDFREGGKWHGGFETEQSAPERVSVPVELLERVATHLEWDGDESQTVIQYANKCDALAAELRALLNGGEA